MTQATAQASYAILPPRHGIPSLTSRLTGHKHATLKASLYTQSIHSHLHGKPSSVTNTLMLLPPRSARIASPHPFTQTLHRSNAALLLTGTALQIGVGQSTPCVHVTPHLPWHTTVSHGIHTVSGAPHHTRRHT